MPEMTLSEGLKRLLDHLAGWGPYHPPELSLVDHWVRSAEDVEDRVRRLTAERDAAAQEAATLRGALGDLLDYQANALLQTLSGGWKQAIGRCRAALATPPTAHANLAAARAKYIAADRMPGGLPDSQEWQAKFARLRAAKDALAEAEAAAGEGGANGSDR